jgi:ABC-type ATPase involved in cell division
MQVEGMFDLTPAKSSRHIWHVDFELPEEWSVGVIVGPSGAGKTTVARELFGDRLQEVVSEWPQDKSILDGFDHQLTTKEVTEMLSSVGLSSPPSWLKPYHVLSNGEKFRVDLARVIAHSKDIAVVDEFTSVVDRQVAQIGSAAVAKTVRRAGKKFVAVTCHYDIIDWLDPDWIYEPHVNRMTRRRLRGRPKIDITIRRVHRSAWAFFMRHHYLSGELHQASRCFVGYVDGTPAVFGAVIRFPHPSVRNYQREHRIVCLPDFQGVGIGNAFSAALGAMCRALGYRYISITSHPAMIRARAKSPHWNMKSAPNCDTRMMTGMNTKKKSKERTSKERGALANRLRASFEYVGPAIDVSTARMLWNGA